MLTMLADKTKTMKAGDLVTWLADAKLTDSYEVGIITNLEERGDDDAKHAGAWIVWSLQNGNSYSWSPLSLLSKIEY